MNKGFWFVLISAVLFATNALWIKLAYTFGITPWDLLALQAIFSALALVMVVGIWYPKSLYLPKKLIGSVALQGIIGCLGTGLAFTLALQYISASLTTLILYTYPAFVLLGSFFFLQKKITKKHLLALITVFIGALLSLGILSSTLGEIHLLGLALAFLSALAYSFFNINGERIMHSVSPLTVTLYAQLTSSITMMLIHPPWKITTGFSPEGILLGLTLALMASVLPFLLVLKGIAIIGANRASIISTFELPTTILLAIIFLGEAISLEQLAGTICILLGIIINNTGQKQIDQVPGH